jgi:hypothetical protein
MRCRGGGVGPIGGAGPIRVALIWLMDIGGTAA